MPLDLTTFTETDPNSHLTVTADKASAVAVTRAETVKLVLDGGADNYNGIELKFDFFNNSSGADDGRQGIGFSDTNASCATWESDSIHLEAVDQGGDGPIMQLMRGPHDAADSNDTLSENTEYYWTLNRVSDSDTATAKVYSDSSRTSLIDTLTMTGYGTAKWRYLFAFVSRTGGTTGHAWTGYWSTLIFSSLDLPPFIPRAVMF